MKNGLLLINLGTPDSPHVGAVTRYLREFLADKRVITLPAPLRYLLLYGVILPFRPRKSAAAYREIWTKQGSPLLINSQKVLRKLQARLGKDCKVALAMRYGKPSIELALTELKYCENITILPLYPQYSSAATGSSLERVLEILSLQTVLPTMNVIRDFHQHPSFIEAQAALIAPHIPHHDHILFSYHGVPENHILIDSCKTLCVNLCSSQSPNNSGCYRAQCLRTSTALANHLQLPKLDYSSSFQSRLGKTPWIKPYTDEIFSELADRGIKRLAIACPSFVADCLETLEEIGIRARHQWLRLGGEKFTLIPAVNDSELWVNAILAITALPN